jgi:hypothetical protein
MRHAGVCDCSHPRSAVCRSRRKLAESVVRILVAELLIFVLASAVPGIRSIVGIGWGSLPVARRRSAQHDTHQERPDQHQW